MGIGWYREPRVDRIMHFLNENLLKIVEFTVVQ